MEARLRRHRRLTKQIYLLPLLGLLLSHVSLQAAVQGLSPNALVIYGSGGIANWDQGFNESLRNELGPDLGQYFTPETLSLISADDAERELIAESLALKYSNKEIGLIVAVLAEANAFVTEWGHVFAPNAALLRVLPTDEMLQQLGSEPKSVFLVSAIDEAVAKTTDLIPSFFPNLKRIYLIGGAGSGDQAYMRRYKSVLENLNLPYEFRYLSGLPPDELIEVLAKDQVNSAVMTTTYDVDRNGRPMRSLMITSQMAGELDMPVFSMSDPQIPAGAIGGNVTTIDAYARTAKRLITGMLEGVYPVQPVKADTEYLFNGQQLDRFKINRNLLPAGSIIVNDVPNIWRDYSQWLVLGIAIIAVQGLLIVGLLDARRRRRQAEEQLSRAHKLEALGSLAGGIAHDFNNILMSIMANTELVSFRTQSDSETQNRLDKILAASNRAKNLITQILMFNRQAASSEHKALNIKSLIDESSDQIRAALPASCTISIAGEEKPELVIGDAMQLYQVLMNICINAQQAMESKGVITIEVQNLTLLKPQSALSQMIPSGDYVTVAFSDSGVGIKEEDLQHIFEPFYTTKVQGQGTGLGLALVYQIIKAHKGFINVESKPRRGTKVTIFLPAGSSHTLSPAPEEPQQIVRGNNEHILLVDDDELVLDANCQILTKLGYSVTSFSSSVAALKEFSLHPEKFDLVFSDLSMPEMDGVRLISNIQKLNPETPVILCTGYMDALDPADLAELSVLRKPISASEISLAVLSALENSRRS